MLKFNDYLKEQALSAKQKKIAAIAGDKDKIDAADLAALRAGKKPVDECDYGKMKKEELIGNQKKLDKNHNGKLDAQDFKMLRKEEAEELAERDEGKPGKMFGKIAAKAAAKYGSKEIGNKVAGAIRQKVLAKEEAEELDEGRMKELSMDVDDMGDDEFHKKYGNPKHHYTNKPPFDPDPKPAAKVTPGKYGQGHSQAKHLAQKGLAGLTKEETEEVSPYLAATLRVMDEGKIDNLRDAQALRKDNTSAYSKNYKPDTSHPHIQVVKGSAYGGANQKDDEGDEKKPDNETQEKKGRGRPAGKVGKYKARGSKSVDKDVDDREFQLHLPK